MDAPERKGDRHASLLEVFKAVASGFFGVRRRAQHEAVKLRPVQLIVAGIVVAAVFIATLLLVVNFVLSRVGA